MPKQETFVISRPELRKMLVGFGVPEKNIETTFALMDRAHKHVNAIVFAGLLEKANIDRDSIVNIFRRLGMDDVSIANILDSADEAKIIAETGKMFEVNLDFS
jgi:hypothetical protein